MLRIFFTTAFNFIRRLFWLGLWLFGVGLTLWFPMRWWPGDRLRPVQLLNYFMPWFLVVLLPALSLAALARRRRLMVILATPVILISLQIAPLFLPRSNSALASSSAIKVLSYNIWGHNHDPETVIQVIQREKPDVILLQELRAGMKQRLQARLPDLYPDDKLHFDFQGQMQQGIISRFPLTPMGASIVQGRAQKVRLDTPSGPMMVWNVHTTQPGRWSTHYNQMVNLAEAMAAEDMPLIVGGDFNTTDQSDAYRLINHHLANAHWQAGWGFGFSFPSNVPKIKGYSFPTPMIRIDHIFYSQHFSAFKARTVGANGGSDHLPVVAEILWNK